LLLSDSTWRAPRLRLIANGQVVAGAIEAEVISNNHYAADRFSAAVALGIDPWAEIPFWASEPVIMLEVQFSLDGGGPFVSLVQGAVDSVVIDPAQGLIHVDGRDLTAALIETRTQETFANRTASEIAALLAERHNLEPEISQTSIPVGRYYQSQHDSITLNQFSRTITEWDLLVNLARQEGFDVFVEGRTLHFQPATLPMDIALSIRPCDVIDLKLERSLTLAGDIEVVIKSWNSKQNSAFVQRARAGGRKGARQSGQPQRYVYVRPNLTPDAALKFAQNKLAELTRHERVIEIIMPGELMLSPRSMLMLESTGSDFDQAYYVDVIERRLHHHGGFTQHIRARNTSPRTEGMPSMQSLDDGAA
jgi:phage protein D